MYEALLRPSIGRGAGKHGGMAGLGCDPFKPCAHGRIRRQVDIRLMGAVGVGIKGDVCDAVLIVHEKKRATPNAPP